MSRSGNLTFTFNRPFVVPKLFKDAVIEEKRSLADDQLKATDFLEIFVLSSVFDEESSATRVNDYYFTRFTDMAFDV